MIQTSALQNPFEKEVIEPTYGEMTALPTIGLDSQEGGPVVAPLAQDHVTQDEATEPQVCPI